MTHIPTQSFDNAQILYYLFYNMKVNTHTNTHLQPFVRAPPANPLQATLRTLKPHPSVLNYPYTHRLLTSNAHIYVLLKRSPLCVPPLLTLSKPHCAP